ncbi:MAG: glutamate decarboxylase [Clostridium perfringens]|nr:glutamate decarboxylase [Clostridium perfringens]
MGNLRKDNREGIIEDNYRTPIYGMLEADMEMPKTSLNEGPVSPKMAYQLIKDELLDEGNARQNLATFCQTYMEDEAVKLMSECLEKNAIDKSEYPQTTELENRCIDIIADLWNVPEKFNHIGTSTVGSSEACMLGGLAMKFRWRERAKRFGLDINKKKPNLVISSGYQVCWKKFCVYWDIELRTIPLDKDNMSLNLEKVKDSLDEYTIGVIGLFGLTYTGKCDNIEGLNSIIDEYNKATEHKVYIHIDAASGGFFTPFINPEILWDFRLNNVVSISSSGHKYGLVYPGIGWILWKDKRYLPEELVFEVSYLGGMLPTIAINFSRSASHIIGQYYNFLRLGRQGFKKIHLKTKSVAMYIAEELEKIGLFEILNNGEILPIVCYKLKDDINEKWTLYDLADRLLMKGWQIPAYPLPKDLNNVIIQRIVCRADLSKSLGEQLIRDIKVAVKDLNHATILVESQNLSIPHGFTH